MYVVNPISSIQITPGINVRSFSMDKVDDYKWVENIIKPDVTGETWFVE